jgi:hypothetical protein
MFAVIEFTPGLMPEDDDPPTFDSHWDAVKWLSGRAEEYVNDPDGDFTVEVHAGADFASISDYGTVNGPMRIIEIVSVEA